MTDLVNVATFTHCIACQLYRQGLSENPNAINILENNLDQISWLNLSANPNAIHLMQNNLDKITCEMLTVTPETMDLLEEEKKWQTNSHPESIKMRFIFDYLSGKLHAAHILNGDLTIKKWQRLSLESAFLKKIPVI